MGLAPNRAIQKRGVISGLQYGYRRQRYGKAHADHLNLKMTQNLREEFEFDCILYKQRYFAEHNAIQKDWLRNSVTYKEPKGSPQSAFEKDVNKSNIFKIDLTEANWNSQNIFSLDISPQEEKYLKKTYTKQQINKHFKIQIDNQIKYLEELLGRGDNMNALVYTNVLLTYILS